MDMDSTVKQKAVIREKIKRKRMSLSESELKEKSINICTKIIKSDFYKKAEMIYCYSSINNEVDLSFLIAQALENKKRVALPKVTDKRGKMIFVEISNNEELKTGGFGILEPISNEKAAKANVIIVPGVAFTANGDRIGQAGGFYDRFLSENPIFSVGAAYDFQIFDSLPTQSHDIKMDSVVTDREIYN